MRQIQAHLVEPASSNISLVLMSEGELDNGALVGSLGGNGDVVAVHLEGDLSVGVVDETVFVLACYA